MIKDTLPSNQEILKASKNNHNISQAFQLMCTQLARICTKLVRIWSVKKHCIPKIRTSNRVIPSAINDKFGD